MAILSRARSWTSRVAGVPVGSAPTNVNGEVTLGDVSIDTLAPGFHRAAISGSFAGDASLGPTEAVADLHVTPGIAVVTWVPDNPVPAGQPLGANHLNAAADVPGTFLYTPDVGTILPAGPHTLSTTFTPVNDYYAPVIATVVIDVVYVDQTPPVIAGTPADQTVPASGTGGALASYVTPTATDLIDGDVPVVCSPMSGSAFPVGTTTVTCSTMDFSGTAASTAFTITVLPIAVAPLDARTTRRWHQSQWPSRHLAIFPDGTIAAQTWSNVTVPLLSPASGAVSQFPGGFPNGSTGVAPNPVIWVDVGQAYLIGAWGGPTTYRQDGQFHWRWETGCCNNLGLPYLTVDRSRRRMLASVGFGLYTVPLDTGVPDAPVQGGQASGLVTATRDVAYVAGTTRHVTKWNIAGSQPIFEWSQQLSSGFDTWNFSEGAITASGAFVATRSGSHASPDLERERGVANQRSSLDLG